MGYEWQPIFRMVPDDGPEQVIVLRSSLTDVGGPGRIRLAYRPVFTRAEDVNRRLAFQRFGFRAAVGIAAEVATMADQAALATILSRLHSDQWRIYLSLDGGVVEREVELASNSGPDAIAGKVSVGASFELGLEAIDLIDTIPAMMTDPGGGVELVQNGSFDHWTAATNAQAWAESATGGTINQDAAQQRTGLACMRMDRTGAGTILVDQDGLVLGLSAARLARLQVAVKGSASSAAILKVQLYNNTRALTLSSTGTWEQDVSGPYAIVAPLTTSYVLHELEFRVPTTFAKTDSYKVAVFRTDGTVGLSIYVDDLSIRYPVLGVGVATW